MIKGIVFDLDGCLIDSSAVQKAAFFGSYSIVVGDDRCPTYEEYIKHTGDSVENVLRALNLPLEMASPFRQISRSAVDKIIVNWDAISLIRELRERRVKISICTGKDHDRTEEILKHYSILDLFDFLICADDVEHPKPNPEPILKAIEAMQVDKAEALVVGDGYNDILSAKRAGVRSVLTQWYGVTEIPEEYDYSAFAVEDLKSIILEA